MNKPKTTTTKINTKWPSKFSFFFCFLIPHFLSLGLKFAKCRRIYYRKTISKIRNLKRDDDEVWSLSLDGALFASTFTYTSVLTLLWPSANFWKNMILISYPCFPSPNEPRKVSQNPKKFVSVWQILVEKLYYSKCWKNYPKLMFYHLEIMFFLNEIIWKNNRNAMIIVLTFKVIEEWRFGFFAKHHSQSNRVRSIVELDNQIFSL